MIRNPFRKPYVFSKKWAAWLVVGVPFILYADLTDASAKKSDVVITTLEALFIFALLPWTIMRISRALWGKSPQGKTYDNDGDVIDGEVLNLKVGYRPRVRVRARLVNGVVEIPTGEVAVTEIKSIKAKDPRPLFVKVPLGIFLLLLSLLYFYLLLQPLFLLIYIEIPWRVQKLFNTPQIISRDQMYEQLQTQKFFSQVVNSQALLRPTLIALSVIFFTIILKPFIIKTALIIKTNDGKRMLMPYSYSLNPYIQNLVEAPRAKRFIRKVKKLKKVQKRNQELP
jgi:hypothetical protein